MVTNVQMQFCYEYNDPQVRPTHPEKPPEGLDTINKWLYKYNYGVRVHGSHYEASQTVTRCQHKPRGEDRRPELFLGNRLSITHTREQDKRRQ